MMVATTRKKIKPDADNALRFPATSNVLPIKRTPNVSQVPISDKKSCHTSLLPGALKND